MHARDCTPLCRLLTRTATGLCLAASLMLTGLALTGLALDLKPALAADTAVAAQKALQQDTYATPEQAVEALIAANRSGETAEMLRVLGPKAEALLHSGDADADKEHREKFLASYAHGHTLEQHGEGKIILVVGDRKWPMPIPLVLQDGRWRFDAEAGAQEIQDRRIGRHELNVKEVCLAFVVAQREYADQHHTPDGTAEYARRFLSHAGRHDGLYWPAAQGEPESPLGPLMAFAQAGGGQGQAKPYHGYYYRILTAQGPSARGGAMNYLVRGHMTKGFALLAYPAQYGQTGILTFMVNHNGIVHAKDLGPDTGAIAAKITLYAPDASWKLP